MKVQVRRLHPDAVLPSYAHAGDAALDLAAAEEMTLKPGQRAAVATGIAIAIPDGYAGFLLARSGRAIREGLALVNAPGLIDSGYRGEIKVVVVNLDPLDPIDIAAGDRIAQLVVQRVEIVEVETADELPASDRGDGGFGSSGR